MKKYLIIAACAAFSLALPGAAAAQDGGSCQWSKGHSKKGMMKEADTNGDGAVDKAEFLAAANARAEKHFERMDVNHDGKLDKADHAAHFDRMDANHDGNISRDEFEAAHAARANPCAGNPCGKP